MKASRSGCGYGSGLSITPLTTLKIAVFAPMPSASVRIGDRGVPGALRQGPEGVDDVLLQGLHMGEYHVLVLIGNH